MWRWPPPWPWAKPSGKRAHTRLATAETDRHDAGRATDLRRKAARKFGRDRESKRKAVTEDEAGEGHSHAPRRYPSPASLAGGSVASPPPAKSPRRRERTPHPQHPPRRQRFPKQWQNKASPGIFPGPNNGKKKLALKSSSKRYAHRARRRRR
jgi:hypothetical protein